MSNPGEIFDLCDGKAGELHVAMFEEFPARFHTVQGIFVVMNEVFYVGAGFLLYRHRLGSLYHEDIAEAVLLKEGRDIPTEQINSVIHDNPQLMRLLGVSDAGVVFFGDNDNQKRFAMGGSSGTFYAIEDEAVRIRSAGIAKSVLGADVQVVLL